MNNDMKYIMDVLSTQDWNLSQLNIIIIKYSFRVRAIIVTRFYSLYSVEPNIVNCAMGLMHGPFIYSLSLLMDVTSHLIHFTPLLYVICEIKHDDHLPNHLCQVGACGLCLNGRALCFQNQLLLVSLSTFIGSGLKAG